MSKSLPNLAFSFRKQGVTLETSLDGCPWHGVGFVPRQMILDTSRDARRFLFGQTEGIATGEMTSMSLMQFVHRLVRDEEGQDLIEYALLATFVALVAIAGAQLLGNSLNNWYTAVAGKVDSAAAAAK